jgi:hypothetical protein
MKSASNVKGIETIAVVIINVWMEVSSKGAPKSGKKVSETSIVFGQCF